MNIKDIARIAGVGVSTVSRVINNNPDVKESTRQRILQIIKENNYIPNNNARMLKTNHTKYIGVLIKGVFNPFFSEMVKIIDKTIEESNYTMVLQHVDNSDFDIDAIVAFAKEKRLKGIIYLGGNFARIPSEKFNSLDCKMVILCGNLGKNYNNPDFSSVGINDYKAAHIEMEYMLKKGYKKILVLIGDKKDNGVGRERLKGYLNALKDYNLKKSDIKIIEGNYNYNNAFNQTYDYLRDNNDIDAIVSLSDVMAIGAAKAILKTNRKIGDDIALIGFDGMDIAKYYNPTITTIEQPREEIAKRGVHLMLELLEKDIENIHIVLNAKLIKGNSC